MPYLKAVPWRHGKSASGGQHHEHRLDWWILGPGSRTGNRGHAPRGGGVARCRRRSGQGVLYLSLGWRLDADFATSDDFRVVQLTPTGSACSIIFGKGLTSARPGSTQDLMLVAFDLDAARADLAGRGVDVSDVFHDQGGVFHHAGTTGRVAGPDPKGRSYGSFVSFSDPDGNGWLEQEIKMRLPGR
jgi:hypothetical protein